MVDFQLKPLIGNNIFTGAQSNQPYLDYALLNLIGYAPEDSEIDESIQKNNLTELFFWPASFSRFPLGVMELENLTELFIYGVSESKAILPIPSKIEKLTALESISWSCNIQELPSSISKLNNLKKLNLISNNIETLPDFLFQMNNLNLFV